jgi:hypothetical protein
LGRDRELYKEKIVFIFEGYVNVIPKAWPRFSEILLAVWLPCFHI